LLLFESTTLDPLPCVIQKKQFDGLQAHYLKDVAANYTGKVWHYPVCRKLYNFEQKRLSEFLLGIIGTPYSKMDAFRSGGEGLSFVESLFREADLHHIFCSEAVAAAHTYVGLFKTDNVGRWNPNKLLRQERMDGLLLKPRRLK
jgi:hypothetical protein